ncbi:FHA domain-containing protein [Myxococcus sp. K15C18031901]|uniref:FHA domain-containing protein n=1 Tax=Myxococcus dinghuensis TaxID=2906761 RepID=UPI0020A79022|nr:FHA domain-containing protein [Myxococcus dinghuensis]MCP3098965.1 FHA domain-containing protein [Myxococcus dinghuensis]
MLKLIIEDDEGRKTVVPFVRDEITIGRQEGNTIRLTERNVSRRHARLVRLNGHVVVEDLGSYNGTRINGERIAGQSPLSEGDLIQIGDYDLALQAEGAANAPGAITTKVPARRQEQEPEDSSEAEKTSDEDAPGREEGDQTLVSADKRRNSTSIIRLDHVEADRPRKVVDLDSEEAPRLVVLSPDELRGQEFSCIRTELRIGRTDDNDITLDHRSLSRTHAKLVREDAGEWRVIDMQSANGMTVNGESYAQATLNSGDIIELGHVKMRFLAAGDAADDGPSSEGGMSKLPLVAGLVAILLGGGGVVWWMSRQGQVTTQPNPPVAVRTDTPEQPSTPTPPPAEQIKPPVEQVKPPESGKATTDQGGAEQAPPEQPVVPPAPDPKKIVEDARTAMASLDFAGAAALVKDLKTPEAVVVFKEATTEQAFQKTLNDANGALANNEFAAVKTALKETAKTQRLQEQRKSLETALAAAEVAQAKAAQPVVPTTPPKATQTAQDTLGGENALNEGKKLLGEKKYNEAVQSFKRCLELDPKLVDCHVFLGSALARAGNLAEGAKHYSRFLELAPPDHPRYETVKGFLEEYAKNKK